MIERLESCEHCGFDSADWNDTDTRRTIGAAGRLFELWMRGMTTPARNQRPTPGVWSPLEYVDNTRETLFGLRLLCERAVEAPGTDLGPLIEPAAAGDPRHLDAAATVNALDEEASTFAARLAELDDAEWQHEAVLGGRGHDVRWASRQAVHDLWHHLNDIADGRVGSGDPTPPGAGTVVQVNRSGGGVPKFPVDEVRVGRRGLEGDTQAARLHHGRPWQALCLWSTEVLADLQAEGHPIAAGSAGENFTIEGLDWTALRGGTVLDIGEVRCQLSAGAVPCAKNAQRFSDGDFGRIHHDRHPEWTRWYASVLTPGTVRTGDTVRVVR